MIYCKERNETKTACKQGRVQDHKEMREIPKGKEHDDGEGKEREQKMVQEKENEGENTCQGRNKEKEKAWKRKGILPVAFLGRRELRW